MPRLFVAVWPPVEVLDELSAVPQWRDQGVRWIPRERWHVTLRFVGDADTDEVADAMARTTLHSARARLGPALDVLDERAVVVPVAGVDDLARAVERATTGLGTPPRERSFRGHLTVAKLRRGARPQRVLGQRIDASFDVDVVALVESVLRHDGPEYHTVRTWPCR